MQTIARANRVHEGKNNGLIVDYIETYKALLEALAIYAVGGNKNAGIINEVEPPVKPLEELVNELDEAISATEMFLRDEVHFHLNTIIESEGVQKLSAIQNGVNAVYTNDESKNKFSVLAREVFKKFKALMPDASIYTYKDRRDAINAIYTVITDNVEESDVTAIVKQVQDVVDKSIESLNILLEPSADYGRKIDISSLDFAKIEEDFLKVKHKNTIVKSLRETIEKKLTTLLNQNPLRINYWEKYQEIIDAYNSGKEYATIKDIFDQLIDLYKSMSHEERRAESENMNEDELAVFDMLGRNKKITDKEKAEVKDTAKQLLDRLKANEFKIDRWVEKVQTASAVKKAINDYLFNHLPYPTYNEQEIIQRGDVLFDFFKERYGDK
jgi:type I restriction enzyme R subunit